MHPDSSSTTTMSYVGAEKLQLDGHTTSSTSVYSKFRLPGNGQPEHHNDPLHKRPIADNSLGSAGSSNESVPNSWKPLTSSSSSTSTSATALTPSAAIRNQYYQSHQYLQDYSAQPSHDTSRTTPHQRIYSQESLDDSDHTTLNDSSDDLIYRPGPAPNGPHKTSGPPSFQSFSDTGSAISHHTDFTELDDARSISSVRTVESFRSTATTATMSGNNLGPPIGHRKAGKVSRSGTIFRSSSGLEPKIVVQDGFGDSHKDIDRASIYSMAGSSLLSRLSKSTAPMRAKLSAMSSKTNLRHLRGDSSVSIHPPIRRAAESVYNMPVMPRVTPRRSVRRPAGEKSPLPAFGSQLKLSETLTPKGRNTLVYPALLSKVSEAFKDRVALNTKTKDSIEYKDTFDGKEAVDKLAYIIKTQDRNLALLLGRALDAQKFFHDVNYEHRLRDSVTELYQFKERINIRPYSTLIPQTEEVFTPFDDDRSEANFVSRPKDDEENMPNGIFTVLTDCYSPTCTREQLCYSVSCPRRLEQARNSENRKNHHRSTSRSSLLKEQEEDRLWINNVPKPISDGLSREEKKRQEHIFELIYTEMDFVADLAYVKKCWIQPLTDSDIIDIDRRFDVIKEIFWNITEVHDVNAKLAAAFEKRQKENPVVDQVGDILLEHVGGFQPFVQYGAHQIISKSAFETEKLNTMAFALFVKVTERLPQSRKLELNGYLTKPTTRLGRYNLLLREILKHTPKDHPDQETIPKVMKIIAEFLSSVNHETGKTENRFNLQLLNDRLLNKQMSGLDLDLLAEHREIIMKGVLKKKGSGSESSDLHVFLLDHCLLITKQKFVQGAERYKLYAKPIPLAVLSICLPDQTKRSSTILPYGRPSTGSFTSASNGLDIPPLSSKGGYPISFQYLGKQGSGPIALHATTFSARRQWVEKIENQQQALMEKQKVFDMVPISQKFFNTFNRAHCSATFDNGKSILFGSDQGVYLQEGPGEDLVRILNMAKVSQIDILESSKLILVLSEKNLYTYSLDTLMSHEPNVKRGRKISKHVAFFSVGPIIDKSDPEKDVQKMLVSFVRINAITSTISILEPYENMEAKKKNKHNISRLIRGSNEVLRANKELYVFGEAFSIQYFKNIICVGCPKGFQMVDPNSAEVQSVLDPADERNRVIFERESLKPISMFRHKNGSILLCYNEFAFFIDKKGKRLREDWSIQWEGNPTTCVFRFPYVVAFDSTFIEVRHIDTGDLHQVIPGNNIRCLRPNSTDEIHFVMDDRMSGSEVIFELKFIDKSK
ncbi:CNH domain-containing protein [Phycomyces nitens]|nr:CNH domain-containing protein [Phycomyces nitens]